MLSALHALAAALQVATAPDTVVPPLAVPRPAAATSATSPRAERAARDTTRPRAVEISAGYERRLTIHRWGGYAMLPLFGAQYVLGERILRQKTDLREGRRTAPIDDGLRDVHRVAAYGVAGVFAVNTVTGAWNLWESRGVAEGRALRTAHTLLMLASDAGFVLSGKKGFDHQKHRNVAIGSMAVATLSGAMMYVAGRR
jgi:hypothetical protein